MSDISLILPDKGDMSEKENVEKKLVPMAAEMNRLCAEFFRPGSTAEELSVDMTTDKNLKFFTNIDRRLEELQPKTCTFSCHPDIPQTKGEKRLKVLLSAIVYVKGYGSCSFRLVRTRDSSVVEESEFQVMEEKPVLVQRWLPFGQEDKTNGYRDVCRISPFEEVYNMQARHMSTVTIPIVRRFSLSTVYI